MALMPLPTLVDEDMEQTTSTDSPFPELASRVMERPQTMPMAQIGVSPEERRVQELEHMLQEAQGRAEVMEREAYDKAYAAGEKAGMALGQKRAEQSLEKLEKMMVQAEQQLADLEHQCTHIILGLAQAVMTHVLGDEKERWHTLLLSAVERAALQFPNMQELTLQIHPDDMQAFENVVRSESMNQWRLQSEPSVTIGTCRLMSTQQDIHIDPYQAIADVVSQFQKNLVKQEDTVIL